MSATTFARLFGAVLFLLGVALVIGPGLVLGNMTFAQLVCALVGLILCMQAGDLNACIREARR